MRPEPPTILIIVGITGDLSKRKLLPAIAAVARAGALPERFRVIGITRQPDVRLEDLIAGIADASFLEEHLSLFAMDVGKPEDYGRLAAHIAEIETQFAEPAQRLWYLSVPPRALPPLIESIGISGLAAAPLTKLLLEKPSGTDFESAAALVSHIDTHFAPEQVYRIDHYLAKEMAQNVIVFREQNPLFRRTWHADFIERIEIVASEEIGIEGRAAFYEQTGALRDIVQSHLLQLAALTLMESRDTQHMQEVPLRRLAALKQLHVPHGQPLGSYVRRGQYRGYREEAGNPASAVETAVALTLVSDDPQWAGVPITLITGKMLDRKATEIRLFYRDTADIPAQELTLRLQPDEGIFISIHVKRPGYAHEVEKTVLGFSYAQEDGRLAEAYEKVLVDAIRSDHELFVSNEEVLESWRIVAPVQQAWERSDADLILYEPGTEYGKIKPA